jgi:hypothetical protein
VHIPVQGKGSSNAGHATVKDGDDLSKATGVRHVPVSFDSSIFTHLSSLKIRSTFSTTLFPRMQKAVSAILVTSTTSAATGIAKLSPLLKP